MFTLRSWISLFVGLALTAFGVLPLIKKLSLNIPLSVLALIVAAAGLFLIIDSFAEILNNYKIGWITAVLGLLFMVLGIANAVFGQFKWISPTVFYIIFVIEGVFLVIAWIGGSV